MEPQDRPGWNPPEHDPILESASEPASVELPPSLDAAPSEVLVSTPRRSRVGTGIAVAAIGIGALGIAGTAYAASSSPSPTPSATKDGPSGRQGYGLPGGGTAAPGDGPPGQGTMPGQGRPDGDRGMHGPRGGMGGAGMGIHGTFVVPKSGGGYQTVHTQTGTVSGVSTSSITIKSADGFTKTYQVDADTVVNAQRDGIDSVKTGDEVSILGLEDGDTVSAVRIMDRSRIADGMKRLAPPIPKPSTSSSGATT